MKFTVILPRFGGDAVEIGIVGEWRKEIGDYVGEGETVATVKSAASGAESVVTSPAYGILTRKYVLSGEAVEVGEPFALLSGVSADLTTGRETVPAPFNGSHRYIPGGPEEIVALAPREQALDQHAARSWLSAPHVFTAATVDMSEVMRIAARSEVTPLACVVTAVAGTLLRFPALNAQRISETELRRKRYVHIGITRRTPSGTLVVPVLHDAASKSVRAVARELAEQEEAIAAEGPISPEKMRGATFTVAPAEGGESLLWQTPVLSYPQGARLRLGSIIRTAVALPDDTVAVRPMMHLCLAHDARIAEETTAAAFLADIKRELEDARFLFT